MSWWDLVAEKRKYPFGPSEARTDGDLRFPVAIACGLLSAILFAVSFAAGFMREFTVSWWSFGFAVVCVALAFLLPPRPRK
jgi:hypothetical protein